MGLGVGAPAGAPCTPGSATGSVASSKVGPFSQNSVFSGDDYHSVLFNYPLYFEVEIIVL